MPAKERPLYNSLKVAFRRYLILSLNKNKMNKLISHFFERVPEDEPTCALEYSIGEKILRTFYKSLLIAIPVSFILLVTSVLIAAIV